MPTSTATVKSTSTVSPKVASSTATSERGDLSRKAKLRHSLMW